MSHDFHESRDPDSYYSKRETNRDSGKPLVVALASAVILVGFIASLRAVLAPTGYDSDLSALKTQQAYLEGKVEALERDNKRLNDDLYDLRQAQTELQNRPSQTTVIQQSGGIRLW